MAVGYQSADEERAIAERAVAEDLPAAWLDKVVELVRLTRSHPDIRIGSSVRGIIDTCAVARSLAELRGSVPDDPMVCLDAALMALSGRIRVREGAGRTPEEIVTELWESVFGRIVDRGEADEGKAGAPSGAIS